MERLERLGLGTMNMVRKNEASSIRTIHTALDLGMTLFNTGEFYQGGQSELVFGNAIRDIARDRYFLSVKFGALPSPNGGNYGLDMNPHNIKGHMTFSLRRLGIDYIDLYQPARMDTEIPVEDVVGVIADQVQAGYVRHIGLSHVDAETLRRAHAVHPIHTVEVSYSLIEREIEKELVHTAKELGVKVLAHGITAKGLLRDGVLNSTSYSGDLFSPENREHNLALVRAVKEIADAKGMTLSQLAVAWSLAKYDHMQCLIGTTNPDHLKTSVDALNFTLTEGEVKAIEAAMPEDAVLGRDTRLHMFTNGVWITK